jgi:hypothetical protein
MLVFGIHSCSCSGEHNTGDQTTVLCVRRAPVVTWLTDVPQTDLACCRGTRD